jgi:hypothetical protein
MRGRRPHPGRGEASNEALRRSIADGLAGLAGESQLTIERD